MERFTKEQLLIRIGNQVKYLRLQQGISQVELGLRCDPPKNKQSIERIENGKINTSIFGLYEISFALNVPIEMLFEIDNTQETN